MKEEDYPLVSCIMPTYNRRAFVPFAINYFLRQDYPHKELIIIDDGSDCIKDLVPENPGIRYYRLDKKISLGAKLNAGCGYAQGKIIAHWDDDDWYAANRLTYQVETLLDKQIFIVGINRLLYFDLLRKEAFNYIYPPNERTWLSGSSLCYRKSFWATNQFADINVGMDALFVWRTTSNHLHVLTDATFAVHVIHAENGSPKNTAAAWWHHYPVTALEQLMKEDFHLYTNGHFVDPASQSITGPAVVSCNTKSVNNTTCTSRFKNIFACLVHENKECILDMIHNLQYYDPESLILLYNGSGKPDLLEDEVFKNMQNVFVCPNSHAVEHGYLHNFALECMQFALDKFSFTAFTVVDSDQLLIRQNYSSYIQNYFLENPEIGLLSSHPQKIGVQDDHFYVASGALKEFDLWKPLLESFPGGLNKFVYWTFWPSTVFSAKAIRDLLRLFKENKLLKKIMKETKIWATEEVIFPTLISLLGYKIARNPCDDDYVKYKVSFKINEVAAALEKHTVYWIHPVERFWENPVRKLIREKSNHYRNKEEGLSAPYPDKLTGLQTIFHKMETIGGWLSGREADLLMATTIKAGIDFGNANHCLVEVGSYQGRSTFLFASLIKTYFPERKIYAIDPHDGILGDREKGLHHLPPSFEIFKKNIEKAGLSDYVEIIRDYPCKVKWQQSIALLFVDGLHDYLSVSGDFFHFAPWLSPGAYIAFHDYASYYPGVKKLVDELLASGDYRLAGLEQSLIVIQKTA